MRVVLVSQSVEHNHYLSEEMFANYMKGEKISDLLLLGTIDLLEHTGTDTAQVASYLSHETGSHVTSQDVRNLIAKRLGGATSEERMTSLITRFAETSGNHAAVIEDQHGMACGVVVQSAAQVEAFSLWGDAVVMDWTYNTNNRSYNLGSLVVTGPTGRGIPVLDFLCINEKKETLSAVLTYFKDKNPSWDKIEAFVTDKDFTELSTLKDLFPNAKVCNFFVNSTR
ncbi:hypothetical protein Poli38472_003566 [Pythium oligandrum]|uniref:ZSWIM1/3 RNaseH-like domain-containing protein n=1 Tax=Pythium oligandrum TaxID=41045 RepID=A0A8K1CND4_PYTOL|nr:hypothetical protein Poli38472_003566 [Pythium oligandrum]|eukprot:TMW65801.1 hypothetical protein Poli38472_003566 [Pythium oligandrum]